MASPASTAARRYAEALFQVAHEWQRRPFLSADPEERRPNQVDAFGEGLDLAVRMLGGDQVLGILRNPARPLSERIQLIETLLSTRVPAPVRNLASLLVERGKVDRLPAVAAEYRRLLYAERGIVSAVATAATKLTEAETAALATKLTAMTGRTVDLRVEVDEALIGGITVRVGDTLYDASVRGRLERLRERLVAGAR